MLAWNCTPSVPALWIEVWRVGFSASSINPLEQHKAQLISFTNLKLDQGWSSELRDLVDWSTTSINSLEAIMRKVQKKSFSTSQE